MCAAQSIEGHAAAFSQFLCPGATEPSTLFAFANKVCVREGDLRKGVRGREGERARGREGERAREREGERARGRESERARDGTRDTDLGGC